jgi:hypothetical protein
VSLINQEKKIRKEERKEASRIRFFCVFAENWYRVIQGKKTRALRRCLITSVIIGEAKAIITAFHYSRRVVNNSYLHLGVYIDGSMIGVLQFGYMLNPASAGKVVSGTVQGEYLELNRMWLDDSAPRNSESRAISYAIKYIRRACPSVAWIQSFADERCGGLGVVYQAANFRFIGSHTTAFFELDGETYHKMLLTARQKGGQRGAYLRANFERAEKLIFRQFRYIFFLKSDWMKRLKMAVNPYPKPA